MYLCGLAKAAVVSTQCVPLSRAPPEGTIRVFADLKWSWKLVPRQRSIIIAVAQYSTEHASRRKKDTLLVLKQWNLGTVCYYVELQPMFPNSWCYPGGHPQICTPHNCPWVTSGLQPLLISTTTNILMTKICISNSAPSWMPHQYIWSHSIVLIQAQLGIQTNLIIQNSLFV